MAVVQSLVFEFQMFQSDWNFTFLVLVHLKMTMARMFLLSLHSSLIYTAFNYSGFDIVLSFEWFANLFLFKWNIRVALFKLQINRNF